MRIYLISILLCLALVSGCTSAAVSRVAPQRTMEVAAEQADVKDAIAAFMLSNGYQIVADSDFLMKFDKDVESFAIRILNGSNYDTRVVSRITVTFISSEPTRISWQAHLVANEGSSFERRLDITNNPDGDKIQENFIRLKTVIEDGGE